MGTIDRSKSVHPLGERVLQVLVSLAILVFFGLIIVAGLTDPLRLGGDFRRVLVLAAFLVLISVLVVAFWKWPKQ